MMSIPESRSPCPSLSSPPSISISRTLCNAGDPTEIFGTYLASKSDGVAGEADTAGEDVTELESFCRPSIRVGRKYVGDIGGDKGRVLSIGGEGVFRRPFGGDKTLAGPV